MQDVFHEGERIVQRLTGEGWIAEQNSKMISSQFSNGIINFLKTQQFAVISYKDQKGSVWVTFLSGEAGFINVLDEQRAEIQAGLIVGESIAMHEPHQIGLLIIDTERRIRVRINGIATREQDRFVVVAHQIYGNCPKYIQKRELLTDQNTNGAFISEHRNNRLDRAQENWISTADTFYIGTTNDKGEMDASHRGGNPGFIHVLNAETLLIPDYQGNSLYNTLGNIQSNPSTGLLFIDYDHGHLLQLTGVARLIWEEAEADSFSGAGLLVRFEIRQVLQLNNATELRWGEMELSPYNPIAKN
ncbi:hypothetical protein A8990_104170 [Paenibacillus taihuensis]|uniref:Pyridoxamine 5'-phosphate oxidase N-terminal domain-containing protein n=1 Tax=Paenibacillus taihuensis TaxID=1156355 RepID=A0A3D9SDI2_9BACL|nr:pyridoxamine 5'-phosphate oxidase family protein [Paenibacillus taihuensis]REE91662.1 hypothetical protein A8990_104170 [Paenibacillus taihuensis]